jgi:hypothetical protein
VAGQDIGFADSIIAKEAIGSFGVRPVLRRPGCRCTYSARKLLQKLSQSLAVPDILELASHHFIVYPFIRPEIRRRGLNLSVLPHAQHFATQAHSSISTWLEAEYDPLIFARSQPNLWVIERKGGRLPTNLSRQFSNQGWAWSSSRLPLCASGGVVFDRWYEHSLCILIRLLKRPMSECEISKALQVSNTQSRIWLQKLVGKSVSPKAKKYRKIEQSPQDGGNA